MADWFGNRHNERWTYRKLVWPDIENEVGQVGNIVGGSIELSAYSDLKAAGQVEFLGGTPPDPNNLIRVYYDFEDDNGETDSAILGTFFVTYADVTYRDATVKDAGIAVDGLVASGTANLSSVLTIMLESKPGIPFAVNSGTYYIDRAAELARNLGFKVSVTEAEKKKQCKKDYVYESDDMWRNIINGMLDRADYSACLVDKFGGIIMMPYERIRDRGVSFTFSDGEMSIFEPTVTEVNDWQTSGNVAHIYHETESESLWAVAKNMSGSRASISNRNNIEREITVSDEDDIELDEESQESRIAQLIQRVVNRVKDNSSEIEHITFKHAFVDINPNDKVELSYAGKSWVGTVQSMSISLSPSMSTTTKIRRTIPADIEIYSDGGAL